MCALNSLHPAFELVRSERVSALGITGILCHGGDVYMQVLEGSREAVNTLYNRIVRDARHDPVTLLHYQEITGRLDYGPRPARGRVQPRCAPDRHQDRVY